MSEEQLAAALQATVRDSSPPEGWQSKVWKRIEEDSLAEEDKAEGWVLWVASALVVAAAIAFFVLRSGNDAPAPVAQQEEITPVVTKSYDLEEARELAERRIRELGVAIDRAASEQGRRKHELDLKRVQEFQEALTTVKKRRQRSAAIKADPDERPKPGDKRCLSKESRPDCDVYLDSRDAIIVACSPNDPLCGL